MPRYFFDMKNGDIQHRDDIGMDLIDMQAVAAEAFALLRDTVHHTLPDGEKNLTVAVRDSTEAVVFRGEMLVKGRRF